MADAQIVYIVSGVVLGAVLVWVLYVLATKKDAPNLAKIARQPIEETTSKTDSAARDSLDSHQEITDGPRQSP